MLNTSSDYQGVSGAIPRGRLAVAVSGGVDSLCALILCRKSGRDVIAVHALFSGTEEEHAEAIGGLTENCRILGVPFRVLDLRAEFQASVISYFASAYSRGLTPNPCAVCNRTMKFGALLEKALGLGADRLVTGHYAALSTGPAPASEDAPMLSRAADAHKDQSYFLSLVPRKAFSRVYFPLLAQTKQETRRLVADAGLSVPVSRESQEICFIPREADHYRRFLFSLMEKEGKELPGPGPIVLRTGRTEKPIGRHNGLWRFTEGQRQGIGICWKVPLYVTGKDPSSNTLFVGQKEDTFIREADISDLNLMVPRLPERALIRLRYHQQPSPATIPPTETGIRITLDTPAALSAPGQIAAVYDPAGRILAGGFITKLF